ncbi:MAG: tRNA (N(6)-L-threonylcarbamoyladenosine(37)-C(2))-methylthiotransferase MtaB [Armatimonadetes bacterium]|nr:tRNA (N(6)-L-threonylcarbamoyladenosine(37)-C(2))-methylthiotransferase MtaB [Armatimonadota bacterium]
MVQLRAPRASLYTLGCKVNQYETRQTAEALLRRGYRLVPFGQPADVCIVNTCSVTNEADAKSRAAIRRARRSGDDPLVVATGCYAEIAPEEVSALPGVAAVARNADKPRLAEIVDDLLQRSGRLLFPLEGMPDDPLAPPDPDASELITLLAEGKGTLARTRAVIKIQDGCNHFCSFCIIPYARGRLRSRPAADVLVEARELTARGYRELVLTGICLGDYGDERAPADARRRGSGREKRDPLAALLEELAAIPGVERLRMSSLDPADVSDDLIEAIASIPQVCRHLHLSLQAGDEEVLRRMRRRCTAAQFRDLVERIYARVPEAGLTCDVIAGFPGESEAQFAETARLCAEARFLKIHAFPYSPRAGTTAARWPDDVPPPEKHRRVQELVCLSDRLGWEFAARYLGEEVEVLVEHPDRRAGLFTGLTDNYLRVFFEGEDVLRGQRVRVAVTSVGPGSASGEISQAASLMEPAYGIIGVR